MRRNRPVIVLLAAFCCTAALPVVLHALDASVAVGVTAILLGMVGVTAAGLAILERHYDSRS
jgi:hypothetical protein